MVKKIAKNVMEKGDEQVEELYSKPGEYVGKFAKSEHGKNIGSWAFIIGFVIALLAGIIAGLNATGTMYIDPIINSTMVGVLVLIGLVVGIVNISGKESVSFLIASIAVIVTPMGFQSMSAINVANIGAVTAGFNALAAFLTALTGAIATFVAPAAVIVALKLVYTTARRA